MNNSRFEGDGSFKEDEILDLSQELILTVFTKPGCQPCLELKKKLRLWGFAFTEYNIEEYNVAKYFLKVNGHKTVPQLYFKAQNINAGIDVSNLTIEDIRKYYV